MWIRVVVGSILVVDGAASAMAQGCRQQWTVSALSQVVANASSADEVYRACAVRGSDLRSALRSIARPRSAADSPGGAAQVCLAKLGDDATLGQLRDELRDRYNEGAIVKLARAGTPRSAAIMVDYVTQHQDDRSIIVDLGDAGYDPIEAVWRAIARWVPGAPEAYVIDDTRGFPSRWREWWRQQEGREEFAPSPQSVFPADAVEQCLARKAELGFTRAVLDLDEIDSSSVATRFFRTMAGAEAAPIASLGTVRGTAQAVLAKRGDKHELAKITAEFTSSQYEDAIGKLQIIDRLRSVGILIASMDLSQFLVDGRKTLTPETYQNEARRYLQFVFATLRQMVKEPPVPAQASPIHDQVEQWKRWWATGPTLESLVPVRRGHE